MCIPNFSFSEILDGMFPVQLSKVGLEICSSLFCHTRPQLTNTTDSNSASADQWD